ncbi:hypothetical protein CGC46_08660 [Escherichia coli O121:H19]|nr:hypothetical protein CGC46_08660 [Escherichia coli O121:H19]
MQEAENDGITDTGRDQGTSAVDHDADDDMLMDKVRQATAVLLAYIQGSRDKVIREDGELIPARH